VTGQSEITAIVDALGLPDAARIELRVPKKLLVEQGAPTSGDKRAIQEGIDELQWLATCKPTTIGVPTFVDDQREYLEIAVIGCAFRPEAKSGRLIELIHRAVPYPVVLITSDANGVMMSVAQKRRAQNEADSFVVERVVSVGGLKVGGESDYEHAFLHSLALPQQPRRDLLALYEGWLSRIEALAAARLSGRFEVMDETALIARRRTALGEHAILAREVAKLRAHAARVKQISQRVDLNQKIKAIELSMDHNKKLMLGERL
jgi:hypothetical protein